MGTATIHNFTLCCYSKLDLLQIRYVGGTEGVYIYVSNTKGGDMIVNEDPYECVLTFPYERVSSCR